MADSPRKTTPSPPAHVPPSVASAERRWEVDRGTLDPSWVNWISAELPTRKLRLDFLSGSVEARILCAEPVQLWTSWESGERIINHRMNRQDKVPYISYLSDLLQEINLQLGRAAEPLYDHVSIWSATRQRLIDCAAETEVVIIPLTGTLELTTPGDGTTKTTESGWMTISPSSTLPSGRWMHLTPSPGGGSWMELRCSSSMPRKDCNEGNKCTHNVCGWSNHRHDGH
jgi:hypothetical protein